MIAARSNIFSTPKKIAGKNCTRVAPGPECLLFGHSLSGVERRTVGKRACSGEMPRTMPVTWARRLSTCEAGIGCGFETGLGTAADPGRANLLLADPTGRCPAFLP